MVGCAVGKEVKVDRRSVASDMTSEFLWSRKIKAVCRSAACVLIRFEFVGLSLSLLILMPPSSAGAAWPSPDLKQRLAGACLPFRYHI